MKILVTGGAGFIGSHFIRHLLRKYPAYRVINLDKLTYASNLGNLDDLKNNRRYRFIKGDICNRSLVKGIVKRCDLIVNFAASTNVDRSMLKPDEFIETNIFGTQVLLDAAKRYRVKRFIQISTDEVYGSISKGSFNESAPLNPTNFYSASKAAAEHLVRAYFSISNLDAIITRSCNNFGPCQSLDKVIPLFINNALLNRPLPLYADGLNVRDWLFVLDNCRAIDILLHKGKAGETYNIAARNELANLKLSKLILRRLNKKLSLIKYVQDRPSHDFRYAMDVRKIRSLGWKPRYSFRQALDITINWYREKI